MSLDAAFAAPHPSLLQQWDPRCKIAGLLMLLPAWSFVQNLRLLPLMLLITIILVRLSHLPARFFMRRLRLPSLFVLILVLLLPFSAGSTVIVDFRVVQLRQEGLQFAGLISIRFICILTTALVLLYSSPVMTNIKALRALGLPSIMADMMLLTWRYLEVLRTDLQRMRIAMQLRGFQGYRLTLAALQTLAWNAGSLILNSFERSHRIYQAMCLRGYGESDLLAHDFRLTWRDGLLLGVFAAAAGVFVGLEVLLTP